MTPEERFTKIENVIQSLTEIQTRHDVQIEKQNLGIRDLITVSRTLLDSQKELTSQVQELSETQKHTDEKLNLLIDTVQRFIQGQSPNGNS